MPAKTKKLFSAADLKIKPFDAADYLTTPARIKGFLNEVIESGEPAAIQHALGVAARAHGMSKVAKASGLSRENLYRSLSAPHEANFSTIVRVADALGFELAFKPKKTRSSRKARAAAEKGSRSPKGLAILHMRLDRAITDAQINAAARSNPDNPPSTKKELARMAAIVRSRGRPRCRTASARSG